MKVLVVFAAVVVVALAENCGGHHDCTSSSTSCDSGYNLKCSTDNECVCIDSNHGTTGTCAQKSDCSTCPGHDHGHGGHGHQTHSGHCVDGHCNCGYTGGNH